MPVVEKNYGYAFIESQEIGKIIRKAMSEYIENLRKVFDL